MSDSSSRLFFTGNTLDQAVMAAASHFELDPDEVDYERIERRTGSLQGRRRVVVRVDSDHPRRDPGQSDAAAVAVEPPEKGPEESTVEVEASDDNVEEVGAPPAAESAHATAAATAVEPTPASEPVLETVPDPVPEPVSEPTSESEEEPEVADPTDRPEERRPRSPGSLKQEIAELADLPRASSQAVATVERGVALIADLGDLDLDVEVYDGDDQLIVEIGGTDQRRIVRGEGRLLLAVQHLLPRILHGMTGEMTPCRVDSGGFRQKRVETLEKVARKAADEVRQGGRSKTLRSMNPADRRTVHLALETDADVTTESDGHGFFKRITVRPV